MQSLVFRYWNINLFFINLQMAKGPSHFDSHYQDIFDNIDVKLIAPLLITSGIVSASEQAELEEKSTKSVELILQKFKSHSNGEALFKDCLIKTSESQNHRRLLSILYNTKDSSSGNTTSYKYSCITNSCY